MASHLPLIWSSDHPLEKERNCQDYLIWVAAGKEVHRRALVNMRLVYEHGGKPDELWLVGSSWADMHAALEEVLNDKQYG